MGRKAHWEEIYGSKALPELSWYQPRPSESLEFFREYCLDTNASIIDVGGGDSLLVDHLLELGYTDITVLDISPTAIARARKRLGSRASAVKWIEADVTAFTPQRQYDCWHDRATFHFLLDEKEVQQYLTIACKALSENGRMILGTFSETGPEKCSGLPVYRYSESLLEERVRRCFRKIKCTERGHTTPAGSRQHFLFCSFKKINTHGHS